MAYRLTNSEVHEDFEISGFDLLGVYVKQSVTCLVQCQRCRRIGLKRHSVVRLSLKTTNPGWGCEACSYVKRRLDQMATANEVQEYFESIGFSFVSEALPGLKTIQDVICDKGHVGSKSADAVKAGSGCKQCALDRHPGIYCPKIYERNKEEWDKDFSRVLYLVSFEVGSTKYHKAGIASSSRLKRHVRHGATVMATVEGMSRSEVYLAELAIKEATEEARQLCTLTKEDYPLHRGHTECWEPIGLEWHVGNTLFNL